MMSPHVTGGPQGAVLIVLSLPKFCWAFLEADPLGLEDRDLGLEVLGGCAGHHHAHWVPLTKPRPTTTHINFLSALNSEGSSVCGL